MKILSVTDVITNSSSEVFILKAPEGAIKTKENILNVHEKGYNAKLDSCSGMGGYLGIGDWTVFYISEAASLWNIIETIRSKHYEKYLEIPEKEFSYTVENWLDDMNLTKEEASQLLYLDSDNNQIAIRDYISDSPIEIIGGSQYDDDVRKIPMPEEAYSILDESGWATIEYNPDFAKYVINQINKSGISTFMDYSKYLNKVENENLKCQ